MILDYPGGPGVITKLMISGVRRQKREPERRQREKDFTE